ncbi:MAG: response regulator [Flavobacteriales bacterium]|nr:response regulator [Bacteroidales bacterium AH-315-I05]PCJ86182.1 MAG: response regulator [Flavobacteriales bacterium]
MIKVLLVEDDETTNFISKMVLKDAGVENVDEVLNGEDACNYLEKDCPDFIFLDIKMPVMDGWEFLDEKKAKGLCKNVKVAMLTSSVHPVDKKKSKKYHCVIAYIEKPLTQNKVKVIMDKLSN